MFKFIIVSILCMFMATGAMAANGSKKPSGWADIPSFCKTQSNTPYEYKKCISLVNSYKQATREHFKNLSAEQLKRIGNSINRLANKNSKRHKSLRDAVKGIGDAIRKPIEVPKGVRRRSMPQQQYYIK